MARYVDVIRAANPAEKESNTTRLGRVERVDGKDIDGEVIVRYWNEFKSTEPASDSLFMEYLSGFGYSEIPEHDVEEVIVGE